MVIRKCDIDYISRMYCNISCPFVPCVQGVKMTAPLDVFVKDKQHAVIQFLV